MAELFDGLDEARPFEGVVSEDGFSVSLATNGRREWVATLEGEFRPTIEGCEVRVDSRLPVGRTISSGVFIGLAVAVIGMSPPGAFGVLLATSLAAGAVWSVAALLIGEWRIRRHLRRLLEIE